ncbi:MAG: hypothetical protein V2A53_08905 [bacterium]
MTFLESLLFDIQMLSMEASEIYNAITQNSRRRIEDWWGWTRTITLVGVIASFTIFFFSVLAGLIWKTGIFVTVSGLIIAPILFIMLAYWTPIAALVGAVIKVLDLKFFGIVEGGKEYAERWLKIISAFLLWELIVSFFLSVVPYWNNPATIPLIGLCAVIMGFMGYVWGRDLWYRTALKTAVVVVFFVNIIFCFFPLCGKALSERANIFDKEMSTSIKKGELGKKTSSATVRTCQSETSRFNDAETVIELKKGDWLLYKLDKNGYTPRIFVPTGVKYELTSMTENPYTVIYENCSIKIIPGSQYVNLPKINPCIFQIYSEEKQRILITGR